MSVRIIFTCAAAAFLPLAAQGAIVDGYCYLEGESYPLHCHSRVEIDNSVIHPAVYTDCDGHYQWLAVGAMNYHTFTYEHPGYWPDEQTEYIPLFGKTLDPITLQSRALCGRLSYPHCPPEWDYCFPAAEGKHDPTSTYRLEWWYVNFYLTDEDDRDYAGIVSFFKPPVLGSPALALISVIDLQQGVQYSDAKLPPIFTAFDQYLDVTIGTDGRFYNRMCCGELVPFEYHVHASGLDNGVLWLDLDMKALKWPMLVSGDGFVEFGGEDWSYYYSHPRLDVLGTLHLPGFPALGKEVRGRAWIDHQWGNFFADSVSWEWLSIQLDDDREIMVANVWVDGEPLGSFSGGLNLYDDNCELEVLEFYCMIPTASWTDPVTGKEFPVAWRVTEPTREIDLSVTAVYDDQIMRIGENQIFRTNFWEGACTVAGTIDGETVHGTAMAEVTHTPPAPCWRADFDKDCDVDTADLLYLLGAWGTPDGDADGDGDTDTADLLFLLATWGQCP
jgi:predicted secreted hydrolase